MAGRNVQWNGAIIALRVRRALGRGLIGIGEATSRLAKENAHVISGDLRRSIHTAEMFYSGAADEEAAKGGDIPNIQVPTPVDSDWVLEVGSWLPYACVEESGRGHRFVGPAVEQMQGARSIKIMRQAFKEEGL